MNDLVNAYGDKLLWHMDTNSYLHVQVMEAESDVYECESVQNFYESASKIIKGFQWQFEDPHKYLKHEHQPIVMN